MFFLVLYLYLLVSYFSLHLSLSSVLPKALILYDNLLSLCITLSLPLIILLIFLIEILPLLFLSFVDLDVWPHHLMVFQSVAVPLNAVEVLCLVCSASLCLNYFSCSYLWTLNRSIIWLFLFLSFICPVLLCLSIFSSIPSFHWAQFSLLTPRSLKYSKFFSFSLNSCFQLLASCLFASPSPSPPSRDFLFPN